MKMPRHLLKKKLNSSLLGDNEPLWRSLKSFQQRHLHNELSESIPAHLLDPGSTTKHMRNVSSRLTVQVLSHAWNTPWKSEAARLAIPPRKYALIREVNLFCDGQLWVFGRAVIPANTLTGRGRVLKRLGTTPLGQILFSDPSLKRSEFEIALLKQDDHDFSALFSTIHEHIDDERQALWARRSLFYFYGKSLLLTEVFTQRAF